MGVGRLLSTVKKIAPPLVVRPALFQCLEIPGIEFEDLGESVIIEAGKTSGTQHQGWEALRLGRSLFIVEDIANDKSLVWPQKLLDYGAQVLSPANPEIILRCLPNPALVVSNDFNL